MAGRWNRSTHHLRIPICCCYLPLKSLSSEEENRLEFHARLSPSFYHAGQKQKRKKKGGKKKSEQSWLHCPFFSPLFLFFLLPVCGNPTSEQNTCYYFQNSVFRTTKARFLMQLLMLRFLSCLLCHSTGRSKRSSNSCTLTRSIAEPMRYTCG